MDETLDATTVNTPVGALPEIRCAQEVAETANSGLANQTHQLRLTRLRAVSLVVFLGSAAFFLQGLFHQEAISITRPALQLAQTWMTRLHASHVMLMGAVSAMLWFGKELTARRLFVLELLLFGDTTLFFLKTQHFETLQYAYLGHSEDPSSRWITLIFIYTLFIPNHWKRAATFVFPMAIAPLACVLFCIWRYPEVHEIMWNPFGRGQIIRLALAMGLIFAVSVYATYMIGALRREAYTARQLGQYRIRERIGVGGMGEVYLAEHQMLKRPCAVKVIRPEKAGDPKAMVRFEREVRTTAELTHFNTVEIYDYGRTDEGTFYYVMEYLHGLSLAELVEDHGPIFPERAVHLLIQISDALAEAHGVGLIHRDIKPANIFAAQRGGVFDIAKLLDFGLAKPVTRGDSADVTQEGVITGTPLYMSPEQAMGGPEPDARSDIYALGAVAYFLLTGRPPFLGDRPMAVLMAHVKDPVIPPTKLRAEIPADLEAIILKCLAKRPEDRYQSSVELRDALAQCQCAGEWTRERANQWWLSLADVRNVVRTNDATKTMAIG